ncbi:general glycosylation pathway protein [Campylobacter hyointestinalis subsp. hyointestinalis]|uniref:General glycosylation pathway protein n=1 Tax=Campylobacter hyointestinalis subsp. hyointestinalis TaxID=91352 RepID=A0A9W5ASM3_CAMHY|nr:STT3 domain-containing protein [Campylobacter hyointestinalis]CUU79804.1 general glycosylation pathway protein [Campylobacter hyointestinalis subsp. hyointestinalis]CUU80601.1 general glycosylation pathway protein [Campylobacter hyointestinalis subsp. hyointestinalis]CUU82189.1 general glycosylation pathway protein [Campylobacter hyointestinalis subsp. hyointestinalis]CUU89646.1 general glycosylation pathway protein [Campylobacter hyointestinalis subsp. hyointestinalis]
MKNLVNFLSLFRSNTFILIILAYAFSVICRFEWAYWASNYAEFFWNNQLMISTNDGYAFAEGARDLLAGFHQPNDLSFYDAPLCLVSAFLVKVTPFSLETVLVYLSVFLAGLVVVPIILIAREIGDIKAGFVAALLASIANSYYNRTMAGYYDTDMLIIVMPVFIFWGLIRLSIKKDSLSFLITSFSMLIYSWWYPSSFSLNAAITLFFGLYTFIFDRKNILNYQAILFMIVAITNIEYIYRGIFILVLFVIFRFRPNLVNLKFMLIVAAVVFGAFVAFGGLNPIWFQLKFYVFRSVSDSDDVMFKYFNVNQTIMESGIVDTTLFAQRISGSVVVFLLSLAGYILLCFKNRLFLITLPMVALGFLALKGGLRFTIYAVPFMAFGFGFILSYLLNLIKIDKKQRKTILYLVGIFSFLPFVILAFLQVINGEFLDEFKLLAPIFVIVYTLYYFKFRKDAKMMILFPVAFFAIVPSMIHIYEYKPLTVFMNSEVKVLDKLKNIADREDYTIAWWDYGYGIRYYSDTKTLIDGGKHLGRENFAVSFALSKPQESSANMARLEVEYTEKAFSDKNESSNLNRMLKDFGIPNVNEFLLSLGDQNFTTPPKSCDIYYYLPDRMIQIFPVVTKFSRLDLISGKEFSDPFFIPSTSFAQGKDGIILSEGIIISNDGTNISFNGKTFRTNTYIQTKYDENGTLKKDIHHIDDTGMFYIVYMADYGRFLIMDKEMFGSTYIKLFVLEDYDTNIFEPVILDPSAKVYKLKK